MFYKGVEMAKLLQVDRKIINLDKVNYFDLCEEGSSRIIVHFDSQTCMEFTEESATQLWELLEEENFLGTSSPRP
jgi:hypothetical protein